jgi:hypothetical protein
MTKLKFGKWISKYKLTRFVVAKIRKSNVRKTRDTCNSFQITELLLKFNNMRDGTIRTLRKAIFTTITCYSKKNCSLMLVHASSESHRPVILNPCPVSWRGLKTESLHTNVNSCYSNSLWTQRHFLQGLRKNCSAELVTETDFVYMKLVQFCCK